jgi:hypothetical protein
MEATCSSETSAGFQPTTWCYIPEDRILCDCNFQLHNKPTISLHPKMARSLRQNKSQTYARSVLFPHCPFTWYPTHGISSPSLPSSSDKPFASAEIQRLQIAPLQNKRECSQCRSNWIFLCSNIALFQFLKISIAFKYAVLINQLC